MSKVFRGWQIPFLMVKDRNDERSVNQRNILLSNYFVNVANNLIGGNFINGLFLLMNADDAYMGLITMSIMFSNILQVFSPLLLERFRTRKGLLIAGRIVTHILNIIVIGVISLLGISNSLKLWLILAVVMVVNVINALIAPGYQIWHIKSIPESMRSRFFSFFHITNSIVIYSIVLLSSRIADGYKQAGNEMAGLMLLRIAALVLAVIDILYLTKIKEYPSPKSQVSVVDVLISPFKEKRYLITVGAACLWSFSASIPGPYFNVYLLKDISLSYSFINVVNMLSLPIMMVVMPLWRRRIDSTSWFHSLHFSIALFSAHYIGLAFVTRGSVFLYPLFLVYAFVISPGINLIFSNLPYVNMPEKNQTNYLGFYAAMNNLAAFLGVLVGREFIRRSETLNVNLFGLIIGNKQAILILTAFIMLIGAVLIKRISTRQGDRRLA